MLWVTRASVPGLGTSSQVGLAQACRIGQGAAQRSAGRTHLQPRRAGAALGQRAPELEHDVAVLRQAVGLVEHEEADLLNG